MAPDLRVYDTVSIVIKSDGTPLMRDLYSGTPDSVQVRHSDGVRSSIPVISDNF